MQTRVLFKTVLKTRLKTLYLTTLTLVFGRISVIVMWNFSIGAFSVLLQNSLRTFSGNCFARKKRKTEIGSTE
jgi:hypothetical protein